jgi:tellurite resistance protein TerC
MTDFLFNEWMGKDLWIWLVFIGVVFSLLIFDLGILHRKQHEIEIKESLWMSAFYIAMGALFGIVVYFVYLYNMPSGNMIDPRLLEPDGVKRAWLAVQLYFTGFMVEKTLAMDNVFVISLIFSFFSIPRLYQHRVLFWGILGVIILRGVMIGLGAALIHQFEWILYVFGAFLVYTGIKILIAVDSEYDIAGNPILSFIYKRFRVTKELRGESFMVREINPATGKMATYVTPLLVALVLIEFADLVFAVDSVPAVFAITQDPYIVYTSNIFAILGLRALYFALAAMIHRFKYLKYALAIILIFIGGKIFAVNLIGKTPAWISLSITIGLLAGGVIYSMWKTRNDPKEIV